MFIIILEAMLEVRTFCLQDLVLKHAVTLGFRGIESNLDRLDTTKI